MGHVQDRWSGRRHGAGLRWRARLATPAGERSRSFSHKSDAQAWLDEQARKLARGEHIPDPRAGRVAFGVLADEWLAGRRHLLKASTAESYACLLRSRVLPRWGGTNVAAITRPAVAAWLGELRAGGLSASRTRQAHGVVSQILDAAVEQGRLVRNVAAGLALPRLPTSDRRYLSHEEVAALAAGCGPYAVLVRFLSYTGCRWGEASALRVGRVDLARRRVTIAEAATEVAGARVVGTPKSHASRDVPLPAFLVGDMAAQIAGRRPDDLVFTAPGGQPLRLYNWRRRVLDPAARAAGLGDLGGVHALRHTAASLAISSGASPKTVQRMLGHASAAQTLDRYASLFESDLDAVADRLDQAARAAAASPETACRRPDAKITDLADWRI